ncbi:toxin protein [Yersinia enterocolitica]|uniref:anthrax toxin-like adenylyl cyclase domain-containing protein n=1 Tax=Yersinia mollaretii TaxID=33060 RepID=UPI0005DC4BE5|nr:anthrax toxin-like adenylyl cyclase domain-containing protein [Yersinia mollaretii]CNK97105.1 toxin protein [Yersinia enterocolitica]
MLSTVLPYEMAFKRVANKYQVVLGLRNPNPLSFTLLRDGAPSKNFHLKAKSSNAGPTAGYIPEEAKYSKINPSRYPVHNNEILQAKKKGAKAVALRVSHTRIVELIKQNALRCIGVGQYSAIYPGGCYQFTIDPNGNVFDYRGNAVNVMTNPPEVGISSSSPYPVTADYDLFAIIPRKQQDYNLLQSGLTPRLLRGRFDVHFLQPTSHLNSAMDENKGNVHFFGETLIKALNKEIYACGYRGGKLVWHGDETGNPFSPGFDPEDKPIFFLPQGSIITIHSKSELLNFYSVLRCQGFSSDYSPRFGF